MSVSFRPIEAQHEDQNYTCPICRDDIEEDGVSHDSTHAFHRTCLKASAQFSQNCPVCFEKINLSSILSWTEKIKVIATSKRFNNIYKMSAVVALLALGIYALDSFSIKSKNATVAGLLYKLCIGSSDCDPLETINLIGRSPLPSDHTMIEFHKYINQTLEYIILDYPELTSKTIFEIKAQAIPSLFAAIPLMSLGSFGTAWIGMEQLGYV